MSVNAVAVRELAEVSRRFNNAALLRALPNLNITREQILRGPRRDPRRR